ADVMLRPAPGFTPGNTAPGAVDSFVLDLIEAPRAIALLNPDDYRRLDAYVLNFQQQTHDVEPPSVLAPIGRRIMPSRIRPIGQRAVVERTLVWTDSAFADYHGPAGGSGGRRIVEQAINPLGRIPVVHIQNLAQPFFYEGLSEVEPLIPLQDELNTRLC